MKIINRNVIQRLFPFQIYERGLNYYHEDRVRGLSYNKQEESWFAEVEGSEDYYVDIHLNEMHAGKIRTFCECPAFDTYNSCKHIVAVMLKISDQRAPKKMTERTTADFLEGILSAQRNNSYTIREKVPMKVEYYIRLDYTNKVWLEIKTGINHCYVIRNVREFLDHVLHNEAHFFTKKFTFEPEEHYFFQQDLEVLEMLQSFILTGDIFTDRDYYSENAYDKRVFLVPPMSFLSILQLLVERNTLVEVGKSFYKDIEIVQEDSPFNFTVAHNDEKELVLKMDGIKDTRYLESYKVIFSEGVFYFPAEEQLEVMKQINRLGMTNHELPISNETADTFFSEALPVLNKLSRVEISEQVTDEIIEFPLRAKMYLQKNEDAIIGKLSYHYGTYEINPFTTRKEKEIIIIRDVEKEQLIMNLI